jgi:hypothetical protein
MFNLSNSNSNRTRCRSGTEAHKPGLQLEPPRPPRTEQVPAIAPDDEEPSAEYKAEVHQKSFPSNHPLIVARNCARLAYVALEEFIERNTRAPAGMGFLAKPVESARVDKLMHACDLAVGGVAPIVMGAATDSIGIAVQTQAKTIRSLLQNLRSTLRFGNFENGVGEDRLPGLIHECIAYQAALADPMNDLTSLSMGIEVTRQ